MSAPRRAVLEASDDELRATEKKVAVLPAEAGLAHLLDSCASGGQVCR